MIELKYNEVCKLIKEGDILLFRGTGFISKWIKWAGTGNYSHVGLASWTNGHRNPPILECVEFREGKGGRAVNLEIQVDLYPGQIDVFRPDNLYRKSFYNPETKSVEEKIVEFDGLAVTRCMRLMTGLPYGWRRIWWLAKSKLAVLRLFYTPDDLTVDMPSDEIIYPVCSTAVAHCFTKHGYDLVTQRSDQWTEPSDISRSTTINYLFTLIP